MGRDLLSMKKILILTANPTNTTPLRLSEEVREIEASWERSPTARKTFDIIVKQAVRPKEFRRALIENKPDIVHFAGHGGGENGLALMGDSGVAVLLKPAALRRFFKGLQDIFHINCVVLNACYSEVQANEISPYVDCVVGMNQKIGDQAAREFAIGFYDTLFAGEPIETSFNIGCSAIELEAIPEHLTPVLKQKDAEDAETRPIEKEEQVTSQPAVARVIDIPFENLDGQVPLGSPFYVERPPAEKDSFNAIQKKAGLIRIKAPRQMGKTSLMSRILAEGETLGYKSAMINLWDKKFLDDIDTFLEYFCACVSDELGIEEKIDKYWKKRLGSQKNCSNYFQKYLLKEIDKPIILGLDEVDRVFTHPEIADDFFALLRSWHELGKNNDTWQKLRLVISHSQEVYIPLNVNRSPFNVGLPIELGEFTREQVKDLVERHGLDWSDAEVDRLMQMIDGHPYLIRVALYQIAANSMTLDKLLEIAPTEEGIYGDHLYRHLLLLEENPRLRDAMLELVESDRPVRLAPVDSFKLKSMGLAKAVGNELAPLCDLYRLYFGDRLND